MRVKSAILLMVFCLTLFALSAALQAEGPKDRLEITFDSYSDNAGAAILSPGISLYKKISEKFMLGAKVRVDAITAATKAYGGRIKNIDAVTGATPAHNFDETRFAPSLTGIYTDGDDSASFGGYYSSERDYKGKAVFANYTRQFNEQNTALGIGISQSFDKWQPKWKRELPNNNRDETKLDLSVSQFLSPTLTAQLIYTYMHSKGFLSSPYHYLVTDSYSTFERYPADRTGNAVALRFVKLLNEPTSLNFAYRYYTDNWGIVSHTLNLELYRDILSNLTLGARYRYYTQTGSDFMKDLSAYSKNDQTVAVDYRQSSFNSNTVGLMAIYKPEWKDFTLLDLNKVKIKASCDYYITSGNGYIQYWYNKDRIRAVFTSLNLGYEF